MSNTNVDLKQAVAEQDLNAIQCFVIDQQNSLLKTWINGNRESFRSILQQSIQKSHREKRQLVAPDHESSYQLGIWEGWLQAFHALYDEESKESDILELAVAKSPNTAKIIRFLYQWNRPICHGELANALEMNYSTLTNAMKKAVGCGAVSASRTGRNTRYTLTAAGRKYCQKEATWGAALRKNQEFELIEDFLQKLKEIYDRRRQGNTENVSDKIKDDYKVKLSDRKQAKPTYNMNMHRVEEIRKFEAIDISINVGMDENDIDNVYSNSNLYSPVGA